MITAFLLVFLFMHMCQSCTETSSTKTIDLVKGEFDTKLVVTLPDVIKIRVMTTWWIWIGREENATQGRSFWFKCAEISAAFKLWSQRQESTIKCRVINMIASTEGVQCFELVTWSPNPVTSLKIQPLYSLGSHWGPAYYLLSSSKCNFRYADDQNRLTFFSSGEFH